MLSKLTAVLSDEMLYSIYDTPAKFTFGGYCMRTINRNPRTKVTRASRAGASEDGIPLLSGLEDGISIAGCVTRNFFHNLPVQGAMVTGAIGLYAATVFGVAELIAAGLSAHVAYRMFAFGEPFPKACENTIKFEMGELPRTDLELCTPAMRTKKANAS
jgi:hypothetical protein